MDCNALSMGITVYQINAGVKDFLISLYWGKPYAGEILEG